jgi:2'-5' RNA ligase
MADNLSLYFTALLPPDSLSNKIDEERNRFATKYQSYHALKTIPHITLLSPFKRPTIFEVEMHLQLEDFFKTISPFTIELSGYGNFQKQNKVIFIKVEKSKEILGLHKNFVFTLRNQLQFSDRETSYMYQPHITIAQKDLTAENFHKAWIEYEAKPFKENFIVRKAVMFKHNFRRWELLSVFPFGD